MAKNFADTLRMLRRGAFNTECGDELAQLIKDVEETGKPGKLTVTIEVKRAGGALAVIGKVTAKAPDLGPESDLLWSTPDGSLTFQNPSQRELDLQTVTTPTRVVAG